MPPARDSSPPCSPSPVPVALADAHDGSVRASTVRTTRNSVPSANVRASRVQEDRLTSDSSRRESPVIPDTPMSISPINEADLSPEPWQQRRATSSAPSSPVSRGHSYRSPTVEDFPEDGEIDDNWQANYDTTVGPRGLRSSSHAVESLPPHDPQNFFYAPGHDDSRYHRHYFEQGEGRQTGLSYDRSTAVVDSRPASRMSFTSDRRRVPPVSIPHDSSSPMPLRPQDGPHGSRALPAFSPPATRSNGLDIFDVGEDDNVPDAVRRRGTLANAEENGPTPIPFEGDPEVHQHDPESHLRGMSDDWIQEVWADPEDTSITLSTFNPRFTRSYGTNRRTASDIRQAIASITGESGFLVIAPDQAQGHRGRGPHEWAVTGLTTDGVGLLLRRRVWSLKQITFFPRRRSLETPRLLLALEGFLDDSIANIQNAVRSTFERPLVRHRIEQLINANPEFSNVPADEAYRRVMSSLRVSVYTLDNGTVVANVFMRSPTLSIRVWRLWIQELRNLIFGSYHTAIARARRITICAGCSGADHPSHLCPFARMQGWNGPDGAGGYSYSCDGRERRDVQQSSTAPTQPDLSMLRRRSSQQQSFQDTSRASRSRRNDTFRDRDLEERDSERAEDQNRERGRTRHREQGDQRSSLRNRRDDSRHARGGRGSFRKEGRWQ